MSTIGKPKIDKRPKQAYMGIRTITPFKGMSKVIGTLSDKMNTWVEERNVKPSGPPFLRYHVIDMRGFMDLEFCVPVRKALPDDGEVKAGMLPAGRYASLIYSGGGISGNRTLIEWVRSQGLEFDRWDTEQGDNFRSRYERYLTDPEVEPRKSRWEIEVAIKLADK
ncbi:MAG TPA: GyrI-like domain-containing protein [Anaerolineales bacterium]|nr:GyrI-like domain-containing protein [Anaerolineales bacterium]